MSLTAGDTPRPFQPPVAQRDIKAEVIHCVGGVYKPIWEYDAKTLAEDLTAHLAYGTGTGTAFWLLTKIW